MTHENSTYPQCLGMFEVDGQTYSKPELQERFSMTDPEIEAVRIDRRKAAMRIIHSMNSGLLARKDYPALRITQLAFNCVFHDAPGSPTQGMDLAQFRAYLKGDLTL